MKIYEFEVVIQKKEDKDATYIEIPLDVEREFGAKRVKVKAKFDGIDYRGSIVKMGLPCYIIGITKEIRNKMGKDYGEAIRVEIEKDEEERIIEVPSEFQGMLNENSCAKEFYESLSFSNKRKYIQWITSAKKEETRVKRMNEAIVKLQNQVKLL